jgi:AcrR family transcriptional regulator
MEKPGDASTTGPREGAPRADEPSPGDRATLREASKQRARSRILHGALAGVAASGLTVTVDEVAAAAGVSRRTVFRHFPNHAELILATLVEIRRQLDEGVPRPPKPDADVHEWLEESAIAMHRLFRDVIGRAFWDLYTKGPSLPPAIAERVAGALDLRHRYASDLAAAAWTALEGEGEPPTWVADVFSMNLSGFATNSLPHYSAEETGRLSARILWLALDVALEEQRRGYFHIADVD